MKRNLVIATCLVLIASCQDKTSQTLEAGPKSSFIFDPASINRKTKDLEAIYKVMSKYYKGVEKGETTLLEEVFHENWFMWDDSPESGMLNVESKSAFIKRIKDRGSFPGYAEFRDITNVDIINDNLAFVRVNKLPSRNATSFFLFKLEGAWTIMDKLWVLTTPEDGNTNSVETLDEVKAAFEGYANGMKGQDGEFTSSSVHADWRRKTINSEGELDVTLFDELSGSGQHNLKEYDALVSLDVYHEKLAIVRVDRVLEASSIFTIMFKIQGKWLIVGERVSQGEAPQS